MSTEALAKLRREYTEAVAEEDRHNQTYQPGSRIENHWLKEGVAIGRKMRETREQICKLLSPEEKFSSEQEIADALKMTEFANRYPVPPADSVTTPAFFADRHVVTLNNTRYAMRALLKALEQAEDAIVKRFLAYDGRLKDDNNESGHGGSAGYFYPFDMLIPPLTYDIQGGYCEGEDLYWAVPLLDRLVSLHDEIFKGTGE